MARKPRTLPSMPRQITADEKVSYRGVTLGRCLGMRWAAWHATAGWTDCAARLFDAKRYVDFMLDDKGVQGKG